MDEMTTDELEAILYEEHLLDEAASIAEYESEEKLYPNDMRCCYNCKHRKYSKCELDNSRRYNDQVCDRYKKDS